MDILVLVVDQCIAAQRALIEQLQDWNIYSIGVASAQEAVDLISSGGVFDAVVVDEMQDAQSDSQSLVHWLRGHGCDIPVALLTEEAGKRKQMDALGCVDILVKPPDYSFAAEVIAGSAAAFRRHNPLRGLPHGK